MTTAIPPTAIATNTMAKTARTVMKTIKKEAATKSGKPAGKHKQASHTLTRSLAAALLPTRKPAAHSGTKARSASTSPAVRRPRSRLRHSNSNDLCTLRCQFTLHAPPKLIEVF